MFNIFAQKLNQLLQNQRKLRNEVEKVQNGGTDFASTGVRIERNNLEMRLNFPKMNIRTFVIMQLTLV